MSCCLFIAAECPLPEHSPSEDYPLIINVDEGTVFDGDADDNYFLRTFNIVGAYTELLYGVTLEWHYTPGRAGQIIQYIRTALESSEIVEIWKVWLMDYYEYDERPIYRVKEISVGELSEETLQYLDEANPWGSKNSERPIYYCVRIVR